MAMTEAKIRAVKDENTYLLLSEPRFRIEGKEFQLLSESELRNKRLVYTAGVELEDQQSEGVVMNKTVAQMVSYVKNGVPFDLVDYRDAKLIFSIIDTFLLAQSRLLPERLGGVKDDMLEDFSNLTKLANMVLRVIKVEERINLMNAPKEPTVKYDNIFDLMLGELATANHVERDITTTGDTTEGYKTPFTNMINNRSFVNRIDRFN